MSVFTNPAGRSLDNAKAYINAVLGLLGDRDPFVVLRTTAPALERIAQDMPADTVRTPEAPGKWAVRDVIQHLADSELVWGYRIRCVLAQDRAPLTGYDQDLWADRLHYGESDPREAASDFRQLRAANLRLLERATPTDLERVGVHAERGEEPLAHMIRLYAGHDILHLRQIDRIAKVVER
jgi:hypothetical protein